MQDLQRRTTVHVDPEIDARGYDKIRSRIEVLTKDGRTLVEWADERYRGGPSNPISDADLEGKFRMCAEGALADPAAGSPRRSHPRRRAPGRRSRCWPT